MGVSGNIGNGGFSRVDEERSWIKEIIYNIDNILISFVVWESKVKIMFWYLESEFYFFILFLILFSYFLGVGEENIDYWV